MYISVPVASQKHPGCQGIGRSAEHDRDGSVRLWIVHAYRVD